MGVNDNNINSEPVDWVELARVIERYLETHTIRGTQYSLLTCESAAAVATVAVDTFIQHQDAGFPGITIDK